MKTVLAPGEFVSYIFVLGYCENPEEHKFEAPDIINKKPAIALLDKYNTDKQVEEALELKEYWAKLLSAFG